MDSDLARGERSELLIFFNGGKAAGCSRVHKHVQAIPKESFGGDPWRNLDKGVLPFSFFEKRFDPSEVLSAEITLEAYQEGLAAVVARIGSVTPEDDGRKRAPAHSVIMDRHRIVVIPRVAAGTGGLGANACGMLGMVWLQSQEMLQKWMEVGPQNILRAAGVDCLS